MKSQFQEKNMVLPIKKFLSLVLSRNAMMLQHLINKFPLYCLSSGRLQEIKNKRRFQTFSFESGWSLMRGGYLQEVPNNSDFT